MAEYDERALEALIDEAACQPNPAMLARLAEGVQACDAEGNIRLAVRLRTQLIWHANGCGQSPQALVAIGWLLGQVDRDPSLESLVVFQGRNFLMWCQKWAVMSAAFHPHVPRTQIEGLLADMQRRYAQRGLSQATVEYVAMGVRELLGDIPAMRAHYERWRALPADEMADCAACVASAVVGVYLAEDDLGGGRTAVARRAGLRECARHHVRPPAHAAAQGRAPGRCRPAAAGEREETGR